MKGINLPEDAAAQDSNAQIGGRRTYLQDADNEGSVLFEIRRVVPQVILECFFVQPQRVTGVHIGRTRSTAGRHIQLALKRLRWLMEGKRYG